MKKKIWIFSHNQIRGPLDKWELKLISTKYRDFLIFAERNIWVEYKQWDGKIGSSDIPPPIPHIVKQRKVLLKRFFKRLIFRNCH